MIEAVGDEYLETYFQTCTDRLKDGGRFLLQVITYPHRHYDYYKSTSDFIRKHIFPGGHLPSVERIEQIIHKQKQLRIIDKHAMGDSYARTLSCWYDTCMIKKESILGLGFDETFFRKWCYYLKYCEAGFASGFLNVYQICFEKKEFS